MCNKTCGNCLDFFPTLHQCCHPMVYLKHDGKNVHVVDDNTPACGFFDPKKPVQKLEPA